LGIAASMICPAPIKRLTYPFAPEVRHPMQRRFVEIMPTWQFLWPAEGMRSALAWLIVFLAVTFTILMLRGYWQFWVWEWALYVCLLVLAFTAARGIGDWLLITLALVVPRLGPWLRESAIANRCKPGLRLVLSMDRLAKAIGTSSLFRVQPHW